MNDQLKAAIEALERIKANKPYGLTAVAEAELALNEIAKLTAPVAADGERETVYRETAMFDDWWEREQTCPEHSLITRNAAQVAWHKRAELARAALSQQAKEQEHCNAWVEICDRSAGAVLNGQKGLIILEADLVRIGDMLAAPVQQDQPKRPLARWIRKAQVLGYPSIDDALAATPVVQQEAKPEQDAILTGLKKAVEAAKEDGMWCPCSGCYETEDGHAVGRYPFSDALGCSLGSGCRECGGLGATWEDFSGYEDLADDEDAAPPQAEAQSKDGQSDGEAT